MMLGTVIVVQLTLARQLVVSLCLQFAGTLDLVHKAFKHSRLSLRRQRGAADGD